MRPRSLLTRITAAMTALSSVLCLGCSGFEPMIDAMHGVTAESAMTCAGSSAEVGPTTPTTQTATAGQARGSVHLLPGRSIISAPGQSGAHAPYDCGCQSCTAPSAVVAAVRALHILPMHAPSTSVAYTTTVSAQPLVPPPERTA